MDGAGARTTRTGIRADRMTARMACGCLVVLGESDAEPVCTDHEEYRVRSVQAPAPRITAVECEASGPLVRKG